MVQITNSFVVVAAAAAAAVVAPAFAAPVIEAREPRASFKTIAKIGSKVASGASLGMTVAPLLQHQQREVQELEARRITSAQAKTIARGVGKAASAAKSGIEFGAAVAPLLPQRQRRSVEYDLVPRKFRVSSSALKTGGKLAAGAAGFAGAVVAANAQQPREFDESEIEAREPKFKIGNIFKTVEKFIREDEGDELMARDYEDEDFYAREFDDIETREPKFRLGNVIKTVGSFIREDDADELLAREPEPFKIGSIFKTVGKFIREDENEDMLARDFDESEIDAREPLFIGGIIKGVGKIAKNFIRETDGLDELD